VQASQSPNRYERAGISAVRAARPTTGPALSIEKLRTRALYPGSSGLRFFCGFDPADPFISSERRDVFPRAKRAGFALKGQSQILWKIMYDAA